MIEPAQLTAYIEKCRHPGSSGDPALALAAWQAGDWTAYVRASPLLGILDAIVLVLEEHGAVPFDPDAKLSRALPDDFAFQLHTAWTGFGCARYRSQWDWILRTLRNSGMDMMTADQREAHAALPSKVLIWRGFKLLNEPGALSKIEDATRGTSWTTDRAVAETYAGFGGAQSVRCLALAVVPRAKIHSYFGIWHSHECVMDRPDEIEGIQAMRLPAPQPRAQHSGLAALAGLTTLAMGPSSAWPQVRDLPRRRQLQHPQD